MRVPLEILIQIIEEAAEILPLSDLFRLRLVNTFFAKNILELVLKNSRLEDGFPEASRYFKCPERLKEKYLYEVIKRHPEKRSVFSTWVQEILDLQPSHVRDDETKRDEIISQLVDAMSWSLNPNIIQLLHFQHYERWINWRADQFKYQSPMYPTILQIDYQTAMLVSAIKRGDCTELQELLDKGMNLMKHSHRFGVKPFDQAMKRGSIEIVTTIAKHVNENYEFNWRHHIDAGLTSAARRGQKDTLDAWVQNCPKTSWISDLTPALVVARLGKIEIVGFILEQSKGDTEKLRFQTCIEAIKYGQTEVVRYLLQTGGFDINGCTNRYLKGPLFTALHDCRKPVRMEMIKLLLEMGADPNRAYYTVRGTPLEWAVVRGNIELVEILLEYGADVNVTSLPERIGSDGPLLLIATRIRSIPLLRLLLAKGADPRFVWKGMTLIKEAVRRELVVPVSSLLVEFGWKERFEQWDPIDPLTGVKLRTRPRQQQYFKLYTSRFDSR